MSEKEEKEAKFCKYTNHVFQIIINKLSKLLEFQIFDSNENILYI